MLSLGTYFKEEPVRFVGAFVGERQVSPGWLQVSGPGGWRNQVALIGDGKAGSRRRAEGQQWLGRGEGGHASLKTVFQWPKGGEAWAARRMDTGGGIIAGGQGTGLLEDVKSDASSIDMAFEDFGSDGDKNIINLILELTIW